MTNKELLLISRTMRQKQTIEKQKTQIADLKQKLRDVKAEYKEFKELAFMCAQKQAKRYREKQDTNFECIKELARIQNVPLQEYRGVGRH